MNPSAKGWIKKLLVSYHAHATQPVPFTLNDFYTDLKACGFIYGTNFRTLFDRIDATDLSHEELCKVNMLLSFLFVYEQYGSEDDFVDSVTKFYNLIDNYKSSFFEELFLGKKKSYDLLESMLNRRIAIDANVITQKFNYFITNTLLFVDILAYEKYISTGEVTNVYLRNLEASIETVIFEALDLKKDKTKYDTSLIKLFEASFRYQDPAAFSLIASPLSSPS